MRKIITFNIDVDSLKVLDSYVMLPCSRSDLLNEILTYILTQPNIVWHFVEKKTTEVKNMMELNVNNE